MPEYLEWMPTLAAMAILTVFFVILFPPTVNIDICASNAGNSTLYMLRPNGNHLYDTISLKAGCQILVFRLTDYQNPSLQWLLPPGAGEYIVRQIYIQAGWFRQEIRLQSLSALDRQNDTITHLPDGVSITAGKEAKSSTLTFSISKPRRLAAMYWGASLLYAALLILAGLLWKYFTKTKWEAKLEQAMENIRALFAETPFRGSTLAILLGFSVILHLYSMTNFMLSIDDELAAFRVDPGIWLRQERWTAYLLERFVFPNPTIPYTLNLLFALFIAFAYFLLITAHRFPNDWRIFFAFPIFSAFPTWYFITDFYANLAATSLGIVLVALAGLVFARSYTLWLNSHKVPWGWLSLQIILVTVALGGYQSFLLLYIAIGIGIILWDTLKQEQNTRELPNILLGLIQIGAISIFSFAICKLINSLLLSILEIRIGPYIQSFWRIQTLLQDPLYSLIQGMISQMQILYRGQETGYGISLSIAGLIVILSALCVFLQTQSKGWKKILVGLLWLGLLVTPFLINLISAMQMPTRALIALPYVFWLLGMLMLQHKQSFATTLSAFILGGFVIQLLTAQGTYMAISYQTQQQDEMMAHDLFRRISEAGEDISLSQPVTIDVYGAINARSTYPKPENSTIGGSFFSWDGGNLNRMVLFMNLMGYTNIVAATPEQRSALTPYFESMPAWPAPGCVQKINGIYLIKLGEYPDPVHAQYHQQP